MSALDQIIADALAGSPETHIAMLAREVVRLREARRVVVPELTEEALVRAGGAYCINDREPFRRGARWAVKFVSEHSRAIPADRVLGDGMVAVDPKMLGCAADFLEEFASRVPGISAVIAALRANQGGAEHGNG